MVCYAKKLLEGAILEVFVMFDIEAMMNISIKCHANGKCMCHVNVRVINERSAHKNIFILRKDNSISNPYSFNQHYGAKTHITGHKCLKCMVN